MKKLMLGALPVLFLVMVALTGNIESSKAGIPASSAISSTGSMIRYVVTVHLANDANIFCGNYLVFMVNGAGQKIAPTQIFVPGKMIYTFYERGTVRNAYRVARMVPDPGVDAQFCRNPLQTQPDAIYDTFLSGVTYTYDLYPVSRGQQN